ncbi:MULTISPECIES: TauD/TfdA family dioxygenase [Paraburkholderia]|uniref:TauD/TfdA family dioxygenase n=1 Tax=Paraburkholderia TaxID=1822464 RepID=UPI0022513E26|nr:MULTISPECIES: TauD/TfdA family dioxygenase [Paraburkholderia]MCX4165032.1 TauD/TfdA family dioxygenase [Paraburkholderia megapolitana]MDN7160525.1 TauD/TfdA family dioxygenase [Paraburkholderia sp. CHISQ3]MDQ6497572.1 TauD/TfdA family dioxygenase [Paraburkholderia megapolitana]
MNHATPSLKQAPVDDPAAWTSRTLGGFETLRYSLAPDEIDALKAVLAQTKSQRPQSTTREDFLHPALVTLYRDVQHALMDGRGAIVISGVTQEQFTAEQFERIFWGIGTQLGTAAVQSAAGDRLGHVRVEDNPKNRGYLSSRELGFHSDAFELMGLMCVERAERGGVTRLASGLAVHNRILAERPDLLPALYEGYYYATAEGADGKRPVTPYKIPVFSQVDDKASCMCLKAYMSAAATRLNTTLPDDLNEALLLFLEIAEREEIKIEFLLNPGDILLCNNFALLHARSPFENSPEHKRHMLRLWLKVPDGRPVVAPLLERGVEYERIWLEQTTLEQP